jgi:hypothetical protein
MFNVGDRVRYKRSCNSNRPSGTGAPLTNEYTIKAIRGNHDCYLFHKSEYSRGEAYGDYRWVATDKTLELISDKEITMKKQLKPKRGTIVVNREAGACNTKSTECCGVYEMYGLDRPPQNHVLKIYETFGEERYNVFIFHDVTLYNNGTKLRDFIKRHKLGKILATPSVHNPNTGRNVSLWTWVVNWDNLNRFMNDKVLVVDYSGYYSKPRIEGMDDDWGDDEDYD